MYLKQYIFIVWILSGIVCVNSAFTGQTTLTTVCLPSCDYALDKELALDPKT